MYLGIKEINIGSFSGDRELDKLKLIDELTKMGIKNGIPKGYVAHHHTKNGIMQLIREDIHKQFTHVGGYSLFGGN
ncbi:MAG: HNH endonuclease [Lachnospiraceae bacterium]|nr:HNH endonuclease [Lachnospiraceae bacterium]